MSVNSFNSLMPRTQSDPMDVQSVPIMIAFAAEGRAAGVSGAGLLLDFDAAAGVGEIRDYAHPRGVRR